MKYTLVRDLYKSTKDFENHDVTISGWVRTLRSSNKFGFIELNDGSFFKNLQIVFDNQLSNFEKITKLTISSSIIVEGKVVITEKCKTTF